MSADDDLERIKNYGHRRFGLNIAAMPTCPLMPRSRASNVWPRMRRLFLTLPLIVALMVTTSAKAADPVFEPLPQATKRQLAKQRLFVSSLVAERFPGEKLSGLKSDLQLLQRILDAKLIPKASTWELQALGVVFGDSLIASIPGLAWWQVTDEYGTDPTVRYRETSVQINALTTLSKRVERNETIEVEQLAVYFSKFIEAEAHKYK